MKNFRWYFLGFVILFIAVFGGYFGYGIFLKYYGAEVYPDKAVPPARLTYTSIDKNLLKADLNGPEGLSMAYVVAAKLESWGDTMPIPVLLQKLDSAGATGEDAANWKKVPKALSGISFFMKRTFAASALQADLEKGNYPALLVANESGARHWVLLTGATEDNFLVYDPLSTTGKPETLAKYGNRIYAYRSLYKRPEYQQRQ